MTGYDDKDCKIKFDEDRHLNMQKEEIMDDNRKQQIEALAVASEYCEKLIVGIHTIANEYEGEKLPDTDEYMKHIINGLNWTFEVFNGTKDLINENTMVIDKDEVNAAVVKLNEGMDAKDGALIAQALRTGILKFVTELKTVADSLTAS